MALGDAVGLCCGQFEGKVCEVRRHARAVRVGQCGEVAEPQLPQTGQPGCLVRAVGNGPGAADEGARLVEVRPHPTQHPFGKEMRMDVDQARKPEPRPPLWYVSVPHRLHGFFHRVVHAHSLSRRALRRADAPRGGAALAQLSSAPDRSPGCNRWLPVPPCGAGCGRA